MKETPKLAQVLEKNGEEKQALVFFRKDCPYCRAAYLDLLEAKKNTALPITFINTRSNIGRYLVQKFGLVDASTIVVLEHGTFKKYIYSRKQKGKIQADEETIHQALSW